MIAPEKYKQGHKKSSRKRIVGTTKEYASATTIHGFSYIANENQSGAERLVWAIVVILAITFTACQVCSLYNEWQDEPVITTLETVAEPIEDIKFPAVTICPQGSRQEILDSVLFRQLKEYISKTSSKDVSKMTDEQMMEQVEDFLRDVYPGANGKPTQLIKLLSSDNPKGALQNEAVLGIAETCDPSSNLEILNSLNKELNNDSCPDEFEKLGDAKYCIHSNEALMTYNEATEYCNEQRNAELFYLDSYEDLRALNKHRMAGKFLCSAGRFNLIKVYNIT